MAYIESRIKKDGSKSFRVKVRVRGFPEQYATFTRLTDAKDWAKKTESEIKYGKYFKTAEAKKHTLADAIDRYLSVVMPRKL